MDEWQPTFGHYGKLLRNSHACRVLKTGGRIMISDLVTDGELPESIRKSFDAWAGCVAGALEKAQYLSTIERADSKTSKSFRKEPSMNVVHRHK